MAEEHGQSITDLNFIPQPRVDFSDMTVEMREEALNLAKFVYLARDRGDILTWKECAQAMKVITRLSSV